MFDFHEDKEVYFQYQYLTARDHIIPFLNDVKPVSEINAVLEIGCAEAGVLKAFVEKGCRCVGIELSANRTKRASELQADAVATGQLSFINKNIYDIDPDQDLDGKFDLIILKDVIEHIPDQEKFIPMLSQFLAEDGVVFFGFPPWQMPFGGHQQMCHSPVLSKLPYFHLLPKSLNRQILKSFGESELRQDELIEIWETRISIERFERILKASNLLIDKRKFWLLNPIYKYKFGKGPVAQIPGVGKIAFLRNFLTTAAYYVVRAGK